MLPERGRTLNEKGSFRKIEKWIEKGGSQGGALFPPEAHPDQIEG